MSHSESDRAAFNKQLAKNKHQQDVDCWLQTRPEVGVLMRASGRAAYYQIIGGKQVPVEEFENKVSAILYHCASRFQWRIK
tara:strand:- start:849 stop:1091 length:243 start_codon:yes stop_codon:yes gene_type:complete